MWGIKKLLKLFNDSWLNFLFPSLCLFCKEPSEASLFCSSCWELCALPDPRGRCRHCFAETEETVCFFCRNNPLSPFPLASVFEPAPPVFYLCSALKDDPNSVAAFAFIQWEKLGWPLPDAICPLLEMQDIAIHFGNFLNRPIINALKRGPEEWRCDFEMFQEDAIILLFGQNTAEIHSAADALQEAFPKKIYLLTLLYDLDFVFHSPLDSCRSRSLHGSADCS